MNNTAGMSSATIREESRAFITGTLLAVATLEHGKILNQSKTIQEIREAIKEHVG